MKQIIKNRVTNLLFSRTFRRIKNNPLIFFYIFLFDIIFLLSVSFFNILINLVLPSDSYELSALFSSYSGLVSFAVMYTAAYLVIIIALYSLAKHYVLKLISSMFRLQKSQKGSWKFFLLNLKILGIPLLAAVFLSILIAVAIDQDYAPFLLGIIFALFMIIYYPFINICHSLFSIGEKPARKSIMLSLKKSYSVYVHTILMLTIYYLISLLLTFILKHSLFRTETMYNTYYPSFFAVYSIITIIFFYLILSFNRVAFFQLARDK